MKKYSRNPVFSPVLTPETVMTDPIVAKAQMMIRKAPVVIAINGLDCAGKTSFAGQLHEKLTGLKITTALLHVDDFNNHDVQRQVYDAHNRGKLTLELFELYYHHSIDYDRLARAIPRSRARHDITIIEGVFLFKDSLNHLPDIRIFLSIDPKLARQRYRKRRRNAGDTRPLAVFDDIWLPAFRRYCDDVHPEQISDFIIR